MNNLWLKIAGAALVILVVIVLISVFSSPKTPNDDADLAPEQPEQSKPVQTARQTEQLEQPKVAKDIVEEINPHAENLYQMAVVESKIAKKPMMTYRRMVDYCRQLFKQYPDSSQAEKARELLRQMPNKYKRTYKITNEELGL